MSHLNKRTKLIIDKINHITTKKHTISIEPYTTELYASLIIDNLQHNQGTTIPLRLDHEQLHLLCEHHSTDLNNCLLKTSTGQHIGYIAQAHFVAPQYLSRDHRSIEVHPKYQGKGIAKLLYLTKLLSNQQPIHEHSSLINHGLACMYHSLGYEPSELISHNGQTRLFTDYDDFDSYIGSANGTERSQRFSDYSLRYTLDQPLLGSLNTLT